VVLAAIAALLQAVRPELQALYRKLKAHDSELKAHDSELKAHDSELKALMAFYAYPRWRKILVVAIIGEKAKITTSAKALEAFKLRRTHFWHLKNTKKL
jgi:hypothetical protein